MVIKKLILWWCKRNGYTLVATTVLREVECELNSRRKDKGWSFPDASVFGTERFGEK